jgi:putative YhbY family RNA-binding protein
MNRLPSFGLIRTRHQKAGGRASKLSLVLSTGRMTSPTNPKKRALMPSGKLRQTLRGHGHHLSPIVQIGKGGASPAVLRQVEQALDDHELVKVRVDADSPDDRFAAADALGALAGVDVVQVVGRAILIYKRHPHHPRYEGKRAKSPAARGGAPLQSSTHHGNRRKKSGHVSLQPEGRRRKRPR